MIQPIELSQLVLSDKWPNNNADVNSQQDNPFVNTDTLRTLFPDVNTMCFYSPPYKTLSEYLSSSIEIAETLDGDLRLLTDKVLILGDFGDGSDIYFALHYVIEDSEPNLIKEEWNDDYSKKEWKPFFKDFNELSKVLALSLD